MPSALPLLCQHLHRDDDIQGLCPPGPFLTGPPFSVRIPASFPTFLEDLWSPDSVCCIPTSLQMPALQGARSKPRRRQGPPASTGTHSERQKPRCTVNMPVVCLRCFLPVQERSKPKERTLAAYGWTWCKHSPSRSLETLNFSVSPYPSPAESHSGCQARGHQAGWMQKQWWFPPVSWLLTTTQREARMLTPAQLRGHGARMGAPTHHPWDGTAALGGAEIPPWATPNLRDHPQGTVLGLGFGGDAH